MNNYRYLHGSPKINIFGDIWYIGHTKEQKSYLNLYTVLVSEVLHGIILMTGLHIFSSQIEFHLSSLMSEWYSFSWGGTTTG